MSWLRIDDGFTANSKIAQLTDSEFRCWLRLLCHCAKSADPSVDEASIREVAGLTKQRVERYAKLGLLDTVGASHEVHNWTRYLPKDTPTERQQRWRARNEASTKAALTASTTASTNGSTNASTETSTRVGARAEVPVPSADQEPSITRSVERLATDDDDENESEEEQVVGLASLGFDPDDILGDL